MLSYEEKKIKVVNSSLNKTIFCLMGLDIEFT
jgi:hypothetical protein